MLLGTLIDALSAHHYNQILLAVWLGGTVDLMLPFNMMRCSLPTALELSVIDMRWSDASMKEQTYQAGHLSLLCFIMPHDFWRHYYHDDRLSACAAQYGATRARSFAVAPIRFRLYLEDGSCQRLTDEGHIRQAADDADMAVSIGFSKPIAPHDIECVIAP